MVLPPSVFGTTVFVFHSFDLSEAFFLRCFLRCVCGSMVLAGPHRGARITPQGEKKHAYSFVAVNKHEDKLNRVLGLTRLTWPRTIQTRSFDLRLLTFAHSPKPD